MNLVFLILGCVFIAGAIGAFLFLDVQQKAFMQRVRLHDKASVVCQDEDLTAIIDNPDFQPGCYSFIADFKIVEDLCSKNILTEAMCGKCIDMDQYVEQYQERTETRTVCSRMGRSGPVIEKYEADDQSEEANEARKDERRGSDCREVTETRTDWHDQVDHSESWDFAMSESYENDFYNLQFTALNDDTKHVTFLGHGPHQNHIRKDVVHMLNVREWIGIWSFDSNVAAKEQLCIDHAEARDYFPSDGLTNAEFEALPNYASASHYDEDCTNPGLGDYKVMAKCFGSEDSDIRIIANIDRVGANLTTGAWTDESFPDIEYAIFKMLVFIWEQDSSKSMAQTFADFITVMEEEMKSLKTLIYVVMAVLVVLGLALVILATKDKKGSSSSSSS